MIAISPKALRFARLAAQQQPVFAKSPQIAVIEQHEARRRDARGQQSAGTYSDVSHDTAEFCVRVVESFLGQGDRFDGGDWDGNDFAFMQALVDDLSQQLKRSDVRAV